MSKHTITASLEILISAYGIDGEVFYPEVEIEFEFTPGCPEQGPSYASGGEPATAPEVEVQSVKVIDAVGIDMPPAWWIEKAQDWLGDSGYDAALTAVDEDSGPDPDDLRDRMRDEA